MARTVLAVARSLTVCVLFCVIANLALAYEEPADPCSTTALLEIPAARQNDFRAFQKTVESGTFYRELLRKLGNPQSCQRSADQDSMTVTYAFQGDARLKAQSNSALEFSEQRMQLAGLSSRAALALLKAAEKDFYGTGGCGIRWTKPKREANDQHQETWQMVYAGTTCNCQARVLYKHKEIVALLLRSAC